MRPAFAASLGALKASVFADLAPAIARRREAGLPLAPLHIGDTHRAPAAALADLPAWGTAPAGYAYGPLGGVPALRERIAERFTRVRGVATAPTDVLVTVGATHALLCAVRACVEAGDEVVVLTPYWPLSVGVVRSAGAVPVEVAFTPVLHAEGLEAALAAVRAAIGHRTRGLYFASPNNPCGAVYGRDSLAALVALAERHDLWVFADEVYADYAYDAPFVSAASLGEERVVTLASFSKSHGLPGARVGFLRAAPAVLEAIGKVATHSAFHPSHHAQGLAFAALGSDAWVEEARVDYIEARAAVVDALAAARVPHLPAQGGSYVFADFREAAVRAGGANALFARFVDAGVLVCPGAACGEGFDAFARLCFTGLPVGELRAAMRTLVAALEPSSNS